jgi:TetR/AcrR family transcriptional regulator
MVNKSSSASRSAARGLSESSPSPRRRRARGRPRSSHGEDVRNKLLSTARDLFFRYGYRSVSSRQIAAAAGANVAMIRYYFGGKPGLYREICNSVIEPVRARIDAMSAGTMSVELGMLTSAAIRMWASNPWLIGLILREVLLPDGPFRNLFMREFPERIVPMIEKIVQQEIARGRIRADLDPKLAVLSMISLGLFPFLALPVTSRVFGVRADEEFLQRHIRHINDLLLRGFGAQNAPEKSS